MNKRFTLVELIAVIVTIAILASIALVNISDVKNDGITASINSSTRGLQTAVDKFSLDNDGSVPTVIQPTFEKPQIVQADLLYPEYIKSKPDLNKIKKQKYWVDYSGKVWGSTGETPYAHRFQDSLKIKTQDNVIGYNVYEIVDGKITSKSNHNQIKKVMTIDNKGKDSIQLESLNPNKYLISSIDEYGLETPLVGEESSRTSDWFTPIIKKEGVFVFEMSQNKVMYWDGFNVREEIPPGTSIDYEFAVKDDNGNYGAFSSDFNTLNPSKGIKVKITTKGFNNLLPSVLDMFIYYHYETDKKELFTGPISISTKDNPEVAGTNIITYNFTTPSDSVVDSIHYTGFYNPETSIESEYTYKANDEFLPVPSFSELPPSTEVKVEQVIPKNEGTPSKPVVYVIKKDNYTQDSIVLPTVPQLSENGWKTIQKLRFFSSSNNGLPTKWTGFEVEDNQPENTRIIYTFAGGHNMNFGLNVSDIEKVGEASQVRVTAYLQVKEDYPAEGEHPAIYYMKLISESGATPVKDETGNVFGIFKGLNENAFDGVPSTSVTIGTTPQFVSWNGDMSNKPLELTLYSYGYYSDSRMEIFFLDASGQKVPFVNSDTDTKYDPHMIKGKSTEMATYRIVIPKGAVKLGFVVPEGGGKVHEIKANLTDLVNPPNVTNIITTPNYYDINLTWSKPSSDIQKLAIYRNGVFSGYSTTNEFKDTPLYSSREYNYTIYSIDTVGNRSEGISKKETTLTPPVVFTGLNPSLFADTPTRLSIPKEPVYLDWTGDLGNKVITVSLDSSGYYSSSRITVAFVDENGVHLPFVNANTDQMYSTVLDHGKGLGPRTYNLIVPSNAKRMKVYTPEGTGYVNFIKVDFENFDNPDKVSNIQAVPEPYSMNLSWTIPSTNYAKSAIYRDGKFVAYSTGNTYKDINLRADEEYSYSIYTMNVAGNRSESVDSQFKTIRPTGGELIDAIYPMTGFTSSQGKVLYSTNYGGTWNTWQAFDGKINSGSGATGLITGASGFIGYEFISEKTIKRYTINGGSGASYSLAALPKTWEFQAYDEQTSSWIVLDSKIDQPTWSGNQTRSFDIVNDKAYKSYRLMIIANQGGTYSGVGELKMFR